ncbi:MAG: hypothetical protein JSV17_13710 [Candidatus Aminicenantes bacterium]|nr:MAG: hypothetical protein JSV17_13710 [Candidatus Aminicenantes bacterium]
MRTKVEAIIAVIGVLLVITTIGLIIISRGPLFGKDNNDDWVPNLIGEWIGEANGYAYSDATEWPMETPEYFAGESLSDDGNIIITHQTGQVFAGTFEEGYGIFSGVIMKDRTVSIQFFELSEFRLFFTGRMTKSGGALQMSGYVHAFDDLQPEGNTEMASGYVRLFKVN